MSGSIAMRIEFPEEKAVGVSFYLDTAQEDPYPAILELMRQLHTALKSTKSCIGAFIHTTFKHDADGKVRTIASLEVTDRQVQAVLNNISNESDPEILGLIKQAGLDPSDPIKYLALACATEVVCEAIDLSTSTEAFQATFAGTAVLVVIGKAD